MHFYFYLRNISIDSNPFNCSCRIFRWISYLFHCLKKCDLICFLSCELELRAVSFNHPERFYIMYATACHLKTPLPDVPVVLSQMLTAGEQTQPHTHTHTHTRHQKHTHEWLWGFKTKPKSWKSVATWKTSWAADTSSFPLNVKH